MNFWKIVGAAALVFALVAACGFCSLVSTGLGTIGGYAAFNADLPAVADSNRSGGSVQLHAFVQDDGTKEPAPTVEPTVEPTASPTSDDPNVEGGVENGDTAATPTPTPTPAAPSGDDTYANTVGLGSEEWLGEPGVRTADAGDTNCFIEQSCWHISPDTQVKLTDLNGEGLDLREDGHMMCTLAGGHFKVEGHEPFVAEAAPDQSWVIIMTGLKAGDGDLNLPVTITEYNAGFGLCTNLPPGVKVSEDYFLQNVATAHTFGNCGLSGCKFVRVKFFNANNGHLMEILQDGLDGAWEFVSKNFQ